MLGYDFQKPEVKSVDKGRRILHGELSFASAALAVCRNQDLQCR